VKLTGYPITSTLMGLGAFPASDKHWLGMLGMHGTYEANMAMHDLRRDDQYRRQVSTTASPGASMRSRLAHAKIHVDIDPSSINKNIRVDIPVVGNCANVLEDMIRV